MLPEKEITSTVRRKKAGRGWKRVQNGVKEKVTLHVEMSQKSGRRPGTRLVLKKVQGGDSEESRKKKKKHGMWRGGCIKVLGGKASGVSRCGT